MFFDTGGDATPAPTVSQPELPPGEPRLDDVHAGMPPASLTPWSGESNERWFQTGGGFYDAARKGPGAWNSPRLPPVG